MSLIYCATTDEAVQAHPWEGLAVDSHFFYDLALQNILLGNRLLINAEDIFRHPVLRQELVESPKSLAKLLVQLGQIAVLGEPQDPPAVFHIHAKKIAATHALVRNHNAVIPLPSAAQIHSEFTQLLQQLPTQNPAAHGFYIGEIPEREYSLIVSSFIKRAAVNGGGRELFQQLLDKLYGQTQGPWQSAGKGKLLQLLADVQACATARALGKQRGEAVGVDTQWSALLGTCVPLRPLLMAPLSGPVSLLKLPWPNSLLQPKTVQKILQETTVGEARLNFITNWRKLVQGAMTHQQVETLRHSAEEFNRHLFQLTAQSGSKDTMGNPANLVLCFEPTSFKGAPVLGEIYWQQAFSGAKRLMGLWNFSGGDTGPVDHHSLPAYQLIYAKKKIASILVS